MINLNSLSKQSWFIITIAVISNFLLIPLTIWWIFIIPSLITGALSNRKRTAAGHGAISAAIPWLILFVLHYFSNGLLIMEKVSVMMKLNSPVLLIFISLFIPLLMGALAGISGYFFRQANQ